jgi:hypothetical protein
LATDVDTVRAEATCQLGVVIDEERHVVSVAKAPNASSRLGPFLGSVDALVPELHDRRTSFEGFPHDREQSGHGPLR